jgi:hypothetical protein
MAMLARSLHWSLAVAAMSLIPAHAQEAQATQDEALPNLVEARSEERLQNPQRPLRPGRRRNNSGGAGHFVYLVKDIVRAKGAELCAGYGGPADCIEEVEICLTMVDGDEDVVKLCLNSGPAGREGNNLRKTARQK